ARWVRDLDDDRFAVRQSAYRHLQRAGKRAIPALVRAASSTSLEVSTRVFRLLGGLLASSDESTFEAAHAALTRLAASRHSQASAKARHVLLGHEGRIVATLQKGGAGVTVRDNKIVAVNLDS